MILESAGIFWTPPASQTTYDAPFAFKEDPDRLSFALGLGSETGFEISYRIGHIMMQHLVQVLHSDTQAPNEAFVEAARSTHEILRAQFPYDDIFAPSCTVLGGVIQDNQAWIFWLGSETAWHFRHASLIAATTPHTLGNAFAAAYPGQDIGSLAALAHVTHRALRSGNELYVSEIDTPESPWTLISGDTLIFTTRELTQFLDSQQAAQQLEGKDASQIAYALLSMLPVDARGFGAAAIVIRAKDA